MRLTDLSIKALKPPESGARIYHDDSLTGFGVRVTANGVKSFVLTHGTLRQRETIGRVGILTLQEARSEAKRRLAEYTLGKATPATVSWNTALERYLGEVAKKRKPRTHADYTRLLKKHFRFGDTKLPDITPAMIDGKLRKLSSTPAEQQHAFVVLRAFVKWCYRKSYIDRNPIDRMEEPKGYQARDRVLTNEELRKVWNALEDNTFGRIVKLLTREIGDVRSRHGISVAQRTRARYAREYRRPRDTSPQAIFRGIELATAGEHTVWV
jgi:hypothetical protein